MADELCFSPTCKFNNPLIPRLFFYDLSLLIVSHPLYFSYFIFFSPYIFKFVFFISPLFFTTTALFLLSVVATTFHHPRKLGFIQTVIDKLKSKLNEVDDDDELFNFEDFEIYKIVFHDPPLVTVGDGDDQQAPVMENAVAVVTKLEVVEKSVERLLEELDRFEDSAAAIEKPVMEKISGEYQKTDQNSLPQLDSSSSFGSYGSIEDSTETSEMKENEMISQLEEVAGELQKLEQVKSTISGEDQETVQNSSSMKSNSSRSINDSTAAANEKKLPTLERASVSISGEEDQKTVENSWRLDSCSSFGSYGSMRKEKEWKRTLACKLYEERHNSEGGEEGMDSLWEAYEDNNSSRKSKITKESMITQKKKMMMIKSKKKTEFKCFDDGNDDEEEDDDEFRSSGQLCCLKALKLSTGKMNLGMGKPNLVKISKAIKGFGWLHHVGSKHAKKV